MRTQAVNLPPGNPGSAPANPLILAVRYIIDVENVILLGEDRGKGLSLILLMIGHPQINLLKLLQSLSGLLSSSMKVRPPSPPVFLCHRRNVARVSEPQAIFTRNKNDLYQKLIAFQKREGHTYVQR